MTSQNSFSRLLSAGILEEYVESRLLAYIILAEYFKENMLLICEDILAQWLWLTSKNLMFVIIVVSQIIYKKQPVAKDGSSRIGQ